MKKIMLLGLIFAPLLMTGCSSLTGDGTSQNITVLTVTQDNQALTGAKCDLTNDEGSWVAITPSSTMVHRSNKDLHIICTKEAHDDGQATVVSDTKSNMWGNIIFGGGVGAIIDHNNGSAYEYPSSVKIMMGATKTYKYGDKTANDQETTTSSEDTTQK